MRNGNATYGGGVLRMRLLGDKGLLRGLLTTNLVGVVRPIPPPRDDSEKRHVYLVQFAKNV